MLCPIDLSLLLLLGIVYPFLCERHKKQVRRGLRVMRERVKLWLAKR